MVHWISLNFSINTLISPGIYTSERIRFSLLRLPQIHCSLLFVVWTKRDIVCRLLILWALVIQFYLLFSLMQLDFVLSLRFSNLSLVRLLFDKTFSEYYSLTWQHENILHHVHSTFFCWFLFSLEHWDYFMSGLKKMTKKNWLEKMSSIAIIIRVVFYSVNIFKRKINDVGQFQFRKIYMRKCRIGWYIKAINLSLIIWPFSKKKKVFFLQIIQQ